MTIVVCSKLLMTCKYIIYHIIHANNNFIDQQNLIVDQFSPCSYDINNFFESYSSTCACDLHNLWLKHFEYQPRLLGRRTFDDPEDPAALVGSFKRYKN